MALWCAYNRCFPIFFLGWGLLHTICGSLHTRIRVCLFRNTCHSENEAFVLPSGAPSLASLLVEVCSLSDLLTFEAPKFQSLKYLIQIIPYTLGNWMQNKMYVDFLSLPNCFFPLEWDLGHHIDSHKVVNVYVKWEIVGLLYSDRAAGSIAVWPGLMVFVVKTIWRASD